MSIAPLRWGAPEFLVKCIEASRARAVAARKLIGAMWVDSGPWEAPNKGPPEQPALRVRIRPPLESHRLAQICYARGPRGLCR
eukprot:6101976-Pyramimonas_sp.AAC.1